MKAEKWDSFQTRPHHHGHPEIWVRNLLFQIFTIHVYWILLERGRPTKGGNIPKQDSIILLLPVCTTEGLLQSKLSCAQMRMSRSWCRSSLLGPRPAYYDWNNPIATKRWCETAIHKKWVGLLITSTRATVQNKTKQNRPKHIPSRIHLSPCCCNGPLRFRKRRVQCHYHRCQCPHLRWTGDNHYYPHFVLVVRVAVAVIIIIFIVVMIATGPPDQVEEEARATGLPIPATGRRLSKFPASCKKGSRQCRPPITGGLLPVGCRVLQAVIVTLFDHSSLGLVFHEFIIVVIQTIAYASVWRRLHQKRRRQPWSKQEGEKSHLLIARWVKVEMILKSELCSWLWLEWLCGCMARPFSHQNNTNTMAGLSHLHSNTHDRKFQCDGATGNLKLSLQPGRTCAAVDQEKRLLYEWDRIFTVAWKWLRKRIKHLSLEKRRHESHMHSWQAHYNIQAKSTNLPTLPTLIKISITTTTTTMIMMFKTCSRSFTSECRVRPSWNLALAVLYVRIVLHAALLKPK